MGGEEKLLQKNYSKVHQIQKQTHHRLANPEVVYVFQIKDGEKESYETEERSYHLPSEGLMETLS